MRAFILALIAGVASSGCFSSLTLVKVNADGSGTIELTTTLRKAALAQLDAMPAEAAGKSPRLETWLPEQTTRNAATALGADVSFVSSRAIDTGDVLGRQATYAFADVRRLTLEMIPILPTGGTIGASARFVGDAHFTFDLLDEAERRVLVARFPDAQIEYADADGVAAAATTADPQEQALLRALVSGGRLEIAIEPDLSILQANTPHRSGQRVTLLGIDAERLLLDRDTPDRVRLRPASLDELRYHLHDAAGVAVALDREIRIELAVR